MNRSRVHRSGGSVAQNVDSLNASAVRAPLDRIPDDPSKPAFTIRDVEALLDGFNETRGLRYDQDDIQPTTLQLMAKLTRLQTALEDSLLSLPSSGASSPRGRAAGVPWRSPIAEGLQLPPPGDPRISFYRTPSVLGQRALLGCAEAPQPRLSRFERDRIGRLIAEIVLDAGMLCRICNATPSEEVNLLLPVSLETPRVEDTPFLSFEPEAEIHPATLEDVEGGDDDSATVLMRRTGHAQRRSSMPHATRAGTAYRGQRSPQRAAAVRSRSVGGAQVGSSTPPSNMLLSEVASSGVVHGAPPLRPAAAIPSANVAGRYPAILFSSESASDSAPSATCATAGGGDGVSKLNSRESMVEERARSRNSFANRQLDSSLNAKFVMSTSSGGGGTHDSAVLRRFFAAVLRLRSNLNAVSDEEFASMGLRFCIPHVFRPLSAPASPRGGHGGAPASAVPRAIAEGALELISNGMEVPVTRASFAHFVELVIRRVTDLEGEDYVASALRPSRSPSTTSPPSQGNGHSGGGDDTWLTT